MFKYKEKDLFVNAQRNEELYKGLSPDYVEFHMLSSEFSRGDNHAEGKATALLLSVHSDPQRFVQFVKDEGEYHRRFAAWLKQNNQDWDHRVGRGVLIQVGLMVVSLACVVYTIVKGG